MAAEFTESFRATVAKFECLPPAAREDRRRAEEKELLRRIHQAEQVPEETTDEISFHASLFRRQPDGSVILEVRVGGRDGFERKEIEPLWPEEQAALARWLTKTPDQ